MKLSKSLLSSINNILLQHQQNLSLCSQKKTPPHRKQFANDLNDNILIEKLKIIITNMNKILLISYYLIKVKFNNNLVI